MNCTGNERIRLKSNSWIHRGKGGWMQLNQYHLALGEVVLLQSVHLTKTHPLDHLHLALARDSLSRQVWMVVLAQPTTLQTFQEDGERFPIEEELLDEKSNRFQLERSEIGCVPALSRLCVVMAVATLVLTVQNSRSLLAENAAGLMLTGNGAYTYLRPGWNWLKGVLHQGWRLFSTISLNGHTDPETVSASKKQTQKQLEREFTIKSYSFAS